MNSGHEAILDVAVIGISHQKWGESPSALVIPCDGIVVDAAAIMAWPNERLGKHRRVIGGELREEFPRNVLGEVLKRVLQKDFEDLASLNSEYS